MVLAASGWCWWQKHSGWTEARLERLIRAELPVGSSREQVEAWLAGHRVWHEFRPPERGDRYDEAARRLGLGTADLSGVLVGDFYPAHESLIFKNEIEVYFFFDRNGRLVGHALDVFYDFL
jgi:hypothetical protein